MPLWSVLCGRPSSFFFFFFFLEGRSCLTVDSAKPQSKSCKTSVTAPPPKGWARKGSPRAEQHARTQAEQDGHTFFVDTLLPLLPMDRALLVGENFNCVSEAFDVLGGTAESLIRSEMGYWGGLQRVQADRDLVDIYRELHPIGREITHAGTQSAARLDRWLVSSSLFGRLRAADVGVGVDQLPSGHRAVYVTLRAGRQGPALGRAPWRFSPFLAHPFGGGPGKEVLGQSSTHVRRQNRTATAQGM